MQAKTPLGWLTLQLQPSQLQRRFNCCRLTLYHSSGVSFLSWACNQQMWGYFCSLCCRERCKPQMAHSNDSNPCVYLCSDKTQMSRQLLHHTHACMLKLAQVISLSHLQFISATIQPESWRLIGQIWIRAATTQEWYWLFTHSGWLDASTRVVFWRPLNWNDWIFQWINSHNFCNYTSIFMFSLQLKEYLVPLCSTSFTTFALMKPFSETTVDKVTDTKCFFSGQPLRFISSCSCFGGEFYDLILVLKS